MNTKTIKRYEDTNIRTNRSVFWQAFKKNLGLKRNKGVIISCLVGLIFPPLLLGSILVFLYRAIKTAVELPTAIKKNNENKKLYAFDDNFSLKTTAPINKTLAAKLLAFYTNSNQDKNIHIINAEFISPTNNVFEAIEYNEKENSFVKKRISGFQDGKWITEAVKITNAEIAIAKELLEKHKKAQEDKKSTAKTNSETVDNNINKEQLIKLVDNVADQDAAQTEAAANTAGQRR